MPNFQEVDAYHFEVDCLNDTIEELNIIQLDLCQQVQDENTAKLEEAASLLLAHYTTKLKNFIGK